MKSAKSSRASTERVGVMVALLGLATIGLAFASLNPSEGSSAQSSSRLSAVAFALGTFEGEKVMDDGRTYRVRTRSSWGLDGKSIKGESWDAYGDGDWIPFFKGFEAWHGERERIVFNSVGRDGQFVSGHIEIEQGPRLQWHWTVVNENGARLNGRDTWAFNEDTTEFLWTFATRNEEGSFEPYFEILMRKSR